MRVSLPAPGRPRVTGRTRVTGTARRTRLAGAAVAAALVAAALNTAVLTGPADGTTQHRLDQNHQPSAGVTVIHPEDFGAAGDGSTDDTQALQAAFDSAGPNSVVWLDAGRVYAHSQVLHLRTAGLIVAGPGELLATAEATSSVWIEADHVHVVSIAIATASTTKRWDAWEQMGVRVDGHTGAVLDSIRVSGSAAAGIYVGNGANHFTLRNVSVSDTRADGIHMTGGSYDGRVVSPTVQNSGDDGVAIVSYQSDGTPCHDITVRSPHVDGTTWGRGVSVVGGTDITETGIDVHASSAAGVYVGAEGSPYYTAAPTNVHIVGGTVTDANVDTDVDHGAVLVVSGQSSVAPAGVEVSQLTITDTRNTASRDFGVITYGADPTGVVFDDLTITGGPADAYGGNTPQSSYEIRHVTQNGLLLPDAG